MRGLVGQIITRFENVGLKIVGLKLIRASDIILDRHFPSSDEWLVQVGSKSLESYKEFGIDPIEIAGTDNPLEIGKIIKGWNYHYLKISPLVVMALEGPRAIQAVRKMIGHTLPYKANPGTIRGDFSVNTPDLASVVGSSCKNLVHASGSQEEATNELTCWFSSEELYEWDRVDSHIMFFEGSNSQHGEQNG